MVQVIPVDTHAVGDPNHTPEHNSISDMLGLIVSLLAGEAGTPNTSATPPATAAVAALQAAFTSQTLDNSRVFQPEGYGAKGDGRVVIDGAMSSSVSPTTLTCATSNPFLSTDVGKYVLVEGAGSAGGTNTLVAQISAYISPSQVTLSASALATVSAAYVVYGTDDTAAINLAVSAATTFALAGPMEAVVSFLPKFYMVAANPIQGGATKGNAQIPFPFQPMTSEKLTILFQGIPDTPLIHFGLNSTPMVAGAVLVCCNTTGTLNGTFGPASVMGGYTHEQGAGDSVFSNFRPVIQGLTIVVPYNSTFSGLDCYGCVGMGIRSLCCTAFATPTHMNNPQTNISVGNQWTFGLRTPTTSNDGNPFIDNYVANGFWIGAAISEHVSASRGFTLYNGKGIEFFSTTAGAPMLHCTRLHYWCAEANATHIGVHGTDVVSIDIGTLDVDGGVGSPQYCIDDASSQIKGTVLLRGNSSTYNFHGGMAKLKVVDGDIATGHVASPPSVPGSTSTAALFFRDAMVSVHTGVGVTVSAITIDGTATGLTMAASSSATVLVPAGKTIALTYAGGTPTWDWWAI